jgi:hypothetical protein
MSWISSFYLSNGVNLVASKKEGLLMATTLDEEKLKDLLKSALVEALEEHRDLMQDIMEDAMEDFALARDIEQGLKTQAVSRDEVFAILEGAQ